MLELSLRESQQLGHEYIGTEHILLGLIREGEGVAAQVLVKLGADLNRVRQQVIQLLGDRPREEGAEGETAVTWEADTGLAGEREVRIVGSPAQIAEILARLRSIDARLAAVRSAPGPGGAGARTGRGRGIRPAVRTRRPAGGRGPRRRGRAPGRLSAGSQTAGKIRRVRSVEPGRYARSSPTLPGRTRHARPHPLFRRARFSGARRGGPAVGVLSLQGDVIEHFRALESAGARPLRVRRPDELDQVDGLIIPGGESTTMWKLSVIFEMMEPLRKRISGGMPVFGSCAGMIMLADRLLDGIAGQETLGGIDMTVRRNAFGRQVDSFEADIPVTGVPGPALRAVFIRAPWVEDTGPEVEILGADPGTGRIVAVRQGPALATAFHPELTGDPRVHKLFVDMVRDRI